MLVKFKESFKKWREDWTFTGPFAINKGMYSLHVHFFPPYNQSKIASFFPAEIIGEYYQEILRTRIIFPKYLRIIKKEQRFHYRFLNLQRGLVWQPLVLNTPAQFLSSWLPDPPLRYIFLSDFIAFLRMPLLLLQDGIITIKHISSSSIISRLLKIIAS